MSFYSKRLGRNVDILGATLLMYSEIEYLPELYEVFGRDSILKFLNIFAGQVIRIPTREEMQGHARRIKIWMSVNRNVDSIGELASEFGMTKRQIKTVYEEVDQKLKDVDLEFLK